MRTSESGLNIDQIKPNLVQQLRGFCYAARAGSISRAAERMSLTQPSVSLQVKALEKDFGVALFARHGGRIKLTPEGEMLLEIARPLIEGIEALPKTFADLCGMPNQGKLDIGAGESTLLYLVLPLLKRFSDRYPAVRFRLHNVNGRDGVAMLRKDELDFGVGPLLNGPDDILYRPLFSYDTMLIVPTDHPLAARSKPTLHEISSYDLILPPRELSTWRAVKLVFSQHGLECRIRFEAGGWSVIKKLVEAGLGISIVPALCLTGTDSLFTAPLVDYFPNRTYGVVMRRNKVLSPQAKRFIDIMEVEARQSKAGGLLPETQPVCGSQYERVTCPTSRRSNTHATTARPSNNQRQSLR